MATFGLTTETMAVRCAERGTILPAAIMLSYSRNRLLIDMNRRIDMGRSVETIGDNVIYFDFRYSAENDYGVSIEDERENLQDNIICAVISKYKSFIVTPNQWAKYPHRENKILLENDHVQISISDYCGCGAVSVFVRDDTEYPELAEHWLLQVWDNLYKIISNYVSVINRIGTMSNGVGIFRKG